MIILLIEDDLKIASNVEKFLTRNHISVKAVSTAREGIYNAETDDFDLIILDLMLPDGNGLDICRNLRKQGIETPILILTAKSQIEDKVDGLSTGADDYLTKPFSLEELIARIKAIVRRRAGNNLTSIINVGNLVIDTNTCNVKVGEINLNLAPKEYALLEYLALNKNRVLNRMELLTHVWGESIDPFSNTVDVHVRYLRKKIECPGQKKLIKTVKNKGYILCSD